MSNTQGLDALAALCDSTVAAASASVAAFVDEPAAGAGSAALGDGSSTVVSPPQQHVEDSAAVSNFPQQQALQLQHVQHVLAMRQAAVAAAQQQNQAASMPSQFVEQAQNQLQSLLVAQQQQFQEHQQHQQLQVNTYGVGFQALAAQLLATQQQHQTSAVAYNPSLVATLSPAALAGFIASAGGDQVMSLSTVAMPPPSRILVRLSPLSSNPGTELDQRCDSSVSPENQSSSRSKLARAKSVTVAAPIDDIIMEWEDKKQAKRAANRLSAHLSRKRKKLLIDELKDENVELRRKEQILHSIPDLIVVFDSCGCISFISHSVTRFMGYSVNELEDTSFWNHLSEESVRLMKSAFMDALVVKRRPGEDSTPLANGDSMTVTLIPKREDDVEEIVEGDNEQGLLVSLKGVLHFGGECPECVCSIRPEGMVISKNPANMSLSTASTNTLLRKQQESGAATAVSVEHLISDIDSEKS